MMAYGSRGNPLPLDAHQRDKREKAELLLWWQAWPREALAAAARAGNGECARRRPRSIGRGGLYDS